MHLFHYFTLYHFSEELKKNILHFTLIDCFSQNKDEIVFYFISNNKTEARFLVLNCNPVYPFFYLTADYSKAHKNTVTLFEEVLHQEVYSVHMVEGERVIVINLENSNQLILKLFGKTSNVLYFHYGQVKDIFRHDLEDDYNFKIHPNTSFRTFLDFLNQENLTYQQLLSLPFWDKSFKQLILNHEAEGVSAIETALKLYEIYLHPKFYVNPDPLDFKLFSIYSTEQVYNNILSALQAFAKFYFTNFQLKIKKNEINNFIQEKIKQYEYKVKSNQISIESLLKSRSYEEIANILMANLHLNITNQDQYEFDDFYTNQRIEIRLKPELTLQQNAEWYYQKHKKRKIELVKLQEMLNVNEEQLKKWQSLSMELVNINDHKSLQKWLKQYPELFNEVKEKPKIRLPYREFLVNGYQIWVGKDAMSNDELTLHYAQKNDIWLHAKDVSGSHVIIKMQKGKVLPNEILQHAAELAAYYSKNRHQSDVPVIYTEKKFVRKSKGLPPGKVIVERENIIFVTPQSYENIKKL